MDQAAPGFQAMSANIRLTTYVAVITDTTVEDGTLVMQRLKNGSVRAVLDFSHQKDASANRIIGFLGNIVRMLYPNAKTYQDYDVGKKSDVLQQFLLLGFGSSGKELAQSYDVTAEGTENVGGQDTTKLLLVPKTPTVKDRLLKIEMWIPANAAYPIQQRFYEPANNYRIASYSGINFKPAIKGKQLDLKIPSDYRKSS
jgi:outer membrane lipoprotein-sorting protein